MLFKLRNRKKGHPNRSLNKAGRDLQYEHRLSLGHYRWKDPLSKDNQTEITGFWICTFKRKAPRAVAVLNKPPRERFCSNQRLPCLRSHQSITIAYTLPHKKYHVKSLRSTAFHRQRERSGLRQLSFDLSRMKADVFLYIILNENTQKKIIKPLTNHLLKWYNIYTSSDFTRNFIKYWYFLFSYINIFSI